MTNRRIVIAVLAGAAAAATIVGVVVTAAVTAAVTEATPARVAAIASTTAREPTPGPTSPPIRDTIAPSAPGPLRASEVTVSCVSLTWAAAKDNIGVVGYTVYSGATPLATPLGTPLGTSAGTKTRICDLKPNTTYRLSVRATDANQVGPASRSLSVTTGRACVDPVCEVTTVTEDRDIPWGLVTLPDGTILYSRKDAHDIVLVNPVTGKKTTVGKVPNAYGSEGTDGVLGLAVASTFATDRWLYIFHTSPVDNRIVRMKLTKANTLDSKSLRTLVIGIPHGKVNNGGRLRFGPDGKLYAGTGDAGDGALAQNPQNLAGKVLRLNRDGTTPSDNPARSYIWSLGHRDIQGLAFDAKDRLWALDSGNGTEDELDLIQKGGNYGWPYCEATTSRGRGGCATVGFLKPKYTWAASTCSCSGVAVVKDAIYIAAGRGARLWRLVITGNALTHAQSFLSSGYGRLRTVEPTPDGGLWLATSNGGESDDIPNNSRNRIFRVTLGP